MTARQAVVAEARRWLGTPWRHQASLRGVGVDCGGLIVGVRVALGSVPAAYWSVPGAAEFAGYSRQPDGRLRDLCDRFLLPLLRIVDMQPGDVALMDWGAGPQHLAFVADYRHGGLSLIHALDRRDTARVVEHRLAPEILQRVVAAYALPELT